MDNKQYAVLGLGIFGSTVATTLANHGCEVIVIDKPKPEETPVEEQPKVIKKTLEPAFVRRKRRQNFLIVDIVGESPIAPPPKEEEVRKKKEEPIIVQITKQVSDKKSDTKRKKSPESSRSTRGQEIHRNEIQEYVPPEPEKPRYDKPIQQIILKMANYKRPRSAGADPSSIVQQQQTNPVLTSDIETNIKIVAKRAVTALVNEIKEEIKSDLEEVRKSNQVALSLIDKKVDREFVEKIFNKLRVMMNAFNDQIENMQCSFLNWVTRDELEIVLRQFSAQLSDDNSSGTTSKYHCLLCGQPKQHLAGMINGQSLKRSRTIKTTHK